MRRRTVYRSPLDPSVSTTDESPIKGIRNNQISIFLPDIDDPFHRAYYLPIINAVYIPPTEELSDLDRAGLYWHELTHSRIADSFIVCELRALAARLTAGIIEFLLTENPGGKRLLIPSFTITGPEGEDNTLTRIADRMDELFAATEAIQEIIAYTTRSELDNHWDKKKTKEVIKKGLAELKLEDRAIKDELLDEFLELYEQLGTLAANSLARYALNQIEANSQKIMARFHRAIRVARSFNETGYRTASLYEQIKMLIRFERYLDQHLPDFYQGRCPLSGECLPRSIEAMGDAINQRFALPSNSQLASNHLKAAARLMRHLRCDYHEQNHLGASGSIPDIKRMLLELKPDLVKLFGFEPEAYDWPLTYLSLDKNAQDQYKIAFHKPLVNLVETENSELATLKYILITFEGLRQQMWHGQRLHCICDENLLFTTKDDPNCPYRELLQLIWEHTDPDPRFNSDWKSEEPQCLVGLEYITKLLHVNHISTTLKHNSVPQKKFRRVRRT